MILATDDWEGREERVLYVINPSRTTRSASQYLPPLHQVNRTATRNFIVGNSTKAHYGVLHGSNMHPALVSFRVDNGTRCALVIFWCWFRANLSRSYGRVPKSGLFPTNDASSAMRCHHIRLVCMTISVGKESMGTTNRDMSRRERAGL